MIKLPKSNENLSNKNNWSIENKNNKFELINNEKNIIIEKNLSNYISKEVNEEQINDLIKKTHTKKENLKETQETKLDNLINQEKN